jgi:hypothetical protein
MSVSLCYFSFRYLRLSMLFKLLKLQLPRVKSNTQSRSVRQCLNEFKTSPDIVNIISDNLLRILLFYFLYFHYFIG